MYTPMANANTTPVNDPLPFGQSYWDFLPDLIQDYILDMVEKALFAAAKALHQERMKDVCYQIKAHYHWKHFCFFSSTFSQQCWTCGETISPEFAMGRHMGLCDMKERLADEAFDGSSAHESFYSYSYPYISRSSYNGPPRD